VGGGARTPAGRRAGCGEVNAFRIALANLPYPSSPEDSVIRAEEAIAEAASRGAELICFPEAYVPGYRGLGHEVAPPDAIFLERAWERVAAAAAKGNIGVILGTERVTDEGVLISALVVNRDGSIAGFQDKVQLDPSEDATYIPGARRWVFASGSVLFGVVICHEGWRYPETVRWAAKQGAQIVFHPHLHEAEEGSYRPTTFGDAKNTFHEKAALCRAAENTIFFATVNCVSEGSGTTSAVARPDGTLLIAQPYGEAGLLIADLDLSEATRLLATRCRS
jgi:predicted amidohydrolase